MEITERDLFSFIFCKGSLSEDKAEYIESSEIFKEEINLFSKMKEIMSKEIPSEVREKLASSIPQYKFTPAIDDNPGAEKTKRKKKNGN